ncbi:MAG: pyruvate kinase [Pirellulales bacterium]|nr:pyruvate kinase [Pirellulales bacterium]
MQPFARTKIVATVGPACRDEAMLAELIGTGVDVFRLNMAHADAAEHSESLARIRRASTQLGRPVAVMVDLAGPKIRLGQLPGGALELLDGQRIDFVQGECAVAPGQLTSNYPRLIDELQIGDPVILADGTVSLRVEERHPQMARCRVVQPGLIRGRQGINLPGVKLRVAAMSDADWQHAEWAATSGIDFVSLSFVRAADDVRLLKQRLRSWNSNAKVVAKIEKQEALDQLPAIVDAADAVMVARGDLGVEIDVARVPMVQKEIVALCNRRQKPVMIATQMLDSMQQSRRPTRAEATDVANAILDGADACMLSGETAIGKYPREAVAMMQRIAEATESSPAFAAAREAEVTSSLEGLHPITHAVVRGVSHMAATLQAKLIVVASRSGLTALALSKQRCLTPTVGVCDDVGTLRQMCLYWGVMPLAGAPVSDHAALLQFVSRWGCESGLLAARDRLILVVGTGLERGGHNMALVHEVA